MSYFRILTGTSIGGLSLAVTHLYNKSEKMKRQIDEIQEHTGLKHYNYDAPPILIGEEIENKLAYQQESRDK